MPKPSSDTKQRILATARDLFTQQGVQRTSLQDIADVLGITKPALYYHFQSREDLVRSIVQPLLDDGEKFLVEQEARGDAPVRELIEGFFDFNYRHREDVIMLLTETPTLADLGLIDKALAWRTRLTELISGPEPTLEQAARAILALGGLQDVCMQFPDAPVDELKAAAVTAALDALGR
ncbi:TetR/AcrR family transcriptional regulator [Amycolatopsis sp. NBC_00348]|uniref:TetR/AcrR family transcriptional regulator n=1 Tax=unclassified Amycolatopsis TaxID=2618356 RepID=UPI002E15E943|nr:MULTISPECIES: TetR/AcrR family transcriptional regulator [unclassified Amycolatopsis]WSJ79871.1 TetR/AcrR family transcriptional regulator [Amycolatopsis sp. NBC_01307]